MSSSMLEVQEVELGEAGEIRIKGDEAAAAGEGKGGEVGVCPETVGEIRGERECGKGEIHCGGFSLTEITKVDVPILPPDP